VDSTIEQGVIVSSPSANQPNVRALDFEKSNAMGLAPIWATGWVNYHWEIQNPVKGNFTESRKRIF